jgi:hypothetical protein
MTAYAATMAYRCPCGATTHLFTECDEGPSVVAVKCRLCGEAVGLTIASRIWSASTRSGACRLRLISWEAGHGPLSLSPAGQKTTVWRVV